MGTGAKTAIFVGIIVLIGFVLLVSPYNQLVSLDEAVNQAGNDVQVSLQRRLDLIPNLVETVKGYAAHERETLEAVVKARQQMSQAETLPDKLAADQGLTAALGRLMVVVERYPDLKANENFRALQDQLEGTENRISVARTRFNKAVQEYNTAVRRFPTVFIAGMLGYHPRQGFAAQAGAENAPQVKF